MSKLLSLDIGTEVPELANEYFLVTGSGRYMMNVKLYPESNICIIKVDENGTKYMEVWGLVKVANQQVNFQAI